MFEEGKNNAGCLTYHILHICWLLCVCVVTVDLCYYAYIPCSVSNQLKLFWWMTAKLGDRWWVLNISSEWVARGATHW